jgi:outer membrane lipoprotein-sorting protein
VKKFKTKPNRLVFYLLMTALVISFSFFNISVVKATTQDQVKKFFENLNTLEADFIQVSSSGNVSNGKIYFHLPGKLRIDYSDPNNLLITCKGFWIVIQDRNLKTTNNIPLNQSPFSTLIEKKINLSNQTIKTEFENKSGIISLTLTSSNNEQAGQLTLEFSEKPLSLKKWIIKDNFGDMTTVLIQNAKYNRPLSHLLFFPEDFPDEIN